ncbi:MAG: HEAT repeat domain-containing protein [Planctomycetota bacterium]|nr:MAG: HEAT repeat domain-containing protein [Planctomycetota bacterium]
MDISQRPFPDRYILQSIKAGIPLFILISFIPSAYFPWFIFVVPTFYASQLEGVDPAKFFPYYYNIAYFYCTPFTILFGATFSICIVRHVIALLKDNAVKMDAFIDFICFLSKHYWKFIIITVVLIIIGEYFRADWSSVRINGKYLGLNNPSYKIRVCTVQRIHHKGDGKYILAHLIKNYDGYVKSHIDYHYFIEVLNAGIGNSSIQEKSTIIKELREDFYNRGRMSQAETLGLLSEWDQISINYSDWEEILFTSALKAKTYDVRGSAIVALGKLGRENSIDILNRVMRNDPVQRVKELAREAKMEIENRLGNSTK